MMAFRTRSFTFAVFFTFLVLSALLLLRAADAAPSSGQQPASDGPPVVRIIAPAANSSQPWNSLVSYSIVVSYQGKSTEYQEIPANQVLLTTTYVADGTKLPAGTVPPPTPAGLLDIIRSNCMGCHEFKARAMGPSFAAIAERYPDNPASIEALSRYIRQGSTGVLGQATMPPHPEFSDDQLRNMSLWIAKDAADPNVNNYVGTEGAIRMQSPGTPAPNAGLVLTAAYTSPVAAAKPEQACGSSTVILRGR